MINKSKIDKYKSLVSDAKSFKWCYMNTDNEFKFMDNILVMDSSIEEYKVYNKVGDIEDFTNEAYMEEVLVVLHDDNVIRFYNQNFDEIDGSKVTVKNSE